MWKPSDEVGVRRVAQWLRREAPALWRVDHLTVLYTSGEEKSPWPPPAEVVSECHAATIDGLVKEFGALAVPRLLPEVLFFPAEWHQPPPEHYSAQHGIAAELCHQTALRWVQEHAPPDAIELAAARLRHIVTQGLEAHELTPAERFGAYFLEPGPGRCAEILLQWRDRPPANQAVQELLEGTWDRPLTIPPALREAWGGGDRDWSQAFFGRGTYKFFELELMPLVWQALHDRATAGTLTLERLQDLARRSALFVPAHRADRDREPGDAGDTRLAALVIELAWDVVQRLLAENAVLLDSLSGAALSGVRFVLKACEHVQARVAPTTPVDGWDALNGPLRWLADSHPLSNEPLDALARDLATFDAETLAVVLPHAPATQEAFLRALGWEAALPLLQVIQDIAARRYDAGFDYPQCDVPNSPDPDCGVIDRRRVAAALDGAGERLAREILRRLGAAQLKVANTLKLVEAVAGWNRKQLEKGLSQLGQINLKALGIFPITRGEGEVLERYQRLVDAGRACRKFGGQRQAHVRAAVQAGLTNLAQTAGFEDLGRLEWAMEGRIAEANAAPAATVDGYEVLVEMPALEPVIVVRRGGRTLATIPPVVRKAKQYQELRERQADLKVQVGRFRRSLETMMVSGARLDPETIAKLPLMPPLQRLVGLLVLRANDGRTGMLADAGVVETLGAAPLDLRDGVQVAHPLQLTETGVLGAWQRHIVQRRLVQPFKQVFRETYVLTDRERRDCSTMRFGGHRLESRIVGRLLASRGWEVHADDVPAPFRRFKAAGLRAWLDFPDARHFIGEDDWIETAAITFTREQDADVLDQDQRVRLADVPPTIISETFRDVDLMAAVARAGDDILSPEAYLRRAEAVVSLAALFGVGHVEIDGRFVRIAGTLARYRVHTGSGTVFVEPANAVCILPAPGVPTRDAYLPFAEEDERLAEVVSKVVLLAADAMIADHAILAQIVAARGTV